MGEPLPLSPTRGTQLRLRSLVFRARWSFGHGRRHRKLAITFLSVSGNRRGSLFRSRPLFRDTPSGFTLAEILVVLVIIGILTLFMIPRYEAITSAGTENRAWRILAATITEAQDYAVLLGRPVRIVFDFSQHRVFVPETHIAFTWNEELSIAVRGEKDVSFRSRGRFEVPVDARGRTPRFSVRIEHKIKSLNPFTGLLEERT
ncbi:MAG: prepilin-type N-terminal cleavage/methylation domain-containing protein [Candidatus Hydrogenedentota bacterium]|nr:MAG: prepilin-type N-terminal cleavage/methylation domain-containing protein [Candidatus Hydrogenedentota bacterium]